MTKFTLVATSGFNDGAISVDINAEDGMNETSVLDAIKKASIAYCQTEEGKEYYSANGCSFNYSDFDLMVPNSICKKYGIEKVGEIDRMTMGPQDMDAELFDEEELMEVTSEREEEER